MAIEFSSNVTSRSLALSIVSAIHSTQDEFDPSKGNPFAVDTTLHYLSSAIGMFTSTLRIILARFGVTICIARN